MGWNGVRHSLRFITLCILFSLLTPTLTLSAEGIVPSKTQQEPIQFGVYQGALGEQTIQLTLRSHAEFSGRAQGEYFIFGHGRIIYLAGDIDSDRLWMEESENGTDVSGEWQLKVMTRQSEKYLMGTWQDAEGKNQKEVQLKSLKHLK